MKKITRIAASLAALGSLCVAGAAVAAPWHAGEAAPEGLPPCMSAPHHPGTDRPGVPPADRAEMRAAGWEAIGRILTLRPEQEKAWKAYVEARQALDAMPGAKFDKPAVDMQTRLERRAQVVRIRADLLDKVVAARAELFKVFGPEQKYVLESYELRHAGHGAHRPVPMIRGEGPQCPRAARPASMY